MTPYALLTAAALAAVLIAEYRGVRRVVYAAKPLASAGFIAAALAVGALDTDYGQAVLAALVLSWFGDVFLIPKGKPWFLLGLGAFLLGHVGFCAAFVVRGVGPAATLLSLVPLVPIAIVVMRWLLPHVPDRLRRPVLAYVAVITAMVALSAGTWAAAPDPRIPAAAAMFFTSDLAVARERFVSPTFTNRLWGLPLYYAAQLCFVWTLV